ncbi:uncharacterized protein LOC130533128 isoform X2 [Takifugu flavidus]|uniref:uncharacterized protein LOC130533128 isoform X2 n=1 Tax=Takifugu flavidus TaxID=433684 RepID=UPI002543FDAA|nr:uncharacterized protein LOC130533128 isoform X2 [Takifugu flavidus]
MDLTFVLSAAIFTLLAIVVATSLLSGSSSAARAAAAKPGVGHRNGPASGSERAEAEAKHNGHAPEDKPQQKAADDWCDISGSAHDHWDVVKSVQSEEAQSHLHPEDLATQAEHSSSASTSLEVDTSSEASSGRSRRSFMGLSDKELLKCAFPHPQAEGDAESLGSHDDLESDGPNALRYVPGKARSHHLEMMLSKEELEEEQRVQREQLAAIFQLLKDNQSTFGDVSEGDMEEQLRLYSI